MDPRNPVNAMDLTLKGEAEEERRICVITNSFSPRNLQSRQVNQGNARVPSSASQFNTGGDNNDTSLVVRGSANVSASSQIVGRQL